MVDVRWRLATGFFERLFGLLGRPAPGPAQALWISPCRAVHTIGLGYAIDVVFVGRDGCIVRIVHRLRPGRLAWCPRGRAVIELAAGGAARLGWEVGMRVSPGRQPENQQGQAQG